MFNIEFLKKTFYQAIKFSIVGVFGVLINYSVFLFALIFFKIHYLISGLLGYLFAAIPIFFLNRYWTFKSNVSIFKGFPIYVIDKFLNILVDIHTIHIQRILRGSRGLLSSMRNFCFGHN